MTEEEGGRLVSLINNLKGRLVRDRDIKPSMEGGDLDANGNMEENATNVEATEVVVGAVGEERGEGMVRRCLVCRDGGTVYTGREWREHLLTTSHRGAVEGVSRGSWVVVIGTREQVAHTREAATSQEVVTTKEQVATTTMEGFVTSKEEVDTTKAEVVTIKEEVATTKEEVAMTEEVATWPCSVCGKKFKSYSSRRKHWQKVHKWVLSNSKVSTAKDAASATKEVARITEDEANSSKEVASTTEDESINIQESAKRKCLKCEKQFNTKNARTNHMKRKHPRPKMPMFGEPLPEMPMFGEPLPEVPMFGKPLPKVPKFGEPLPRVEWREEEKFAKVRRVVWMNEVAVVGNFKGIKVIFCGVPISYIFARLWLRSHLSPHATDQLLPTHTSGGGRSALAGWTHRKIQEGRTLLILRCPHNWSEPWSMYS